jgi:dTDP-D-glucose 4,6-dehydratase
MLVSFRFPDHTHNYAFGNENVVGLNHDHDTPPFLSCVSLISSAELRVSSWCKARRPYSRTKSVSDLSIASWQMIFNVAVIISR